MAIKELEPEWKLPKRTWDGFNLLNPATWFKEIDDEGVVLSVPVLSLLSSDESSELT